MPKGGHYKKEGWLTKAEASKIIGCHPKTILYKCYNDVIPYKKIDGVYYIAPETAQLLKQEADEFRRVQQDFEERRQELKRRVKNNENI